MKKLLIIVGLSSIFLGCSKQNDKHNIKSLLVQQLKSTHLEEDWFVPTKKAIEGLTQDQSNWKDSTDNNSIGEIVSHLNFWSEMNLRVLKGEKVQEFKGSNEETFKMNNGENWKHEVKKLNSLQSEWVKLIENASDEQISGWENEIANMTAHLAYHTGQIIYIRKHNDWWN